MPGVSDKKLLILSDGKPGHLNQSIAFARHLDREFDVVEVAFRNRLAKLASYLVDRCGLTLGGLVSIEEVAADYSAVVSAGSETYYANKLLARKLGARSVAIMLPQSYRYNFDLIVAQGHDEPPEHGNILTLPVNLTYVEPQGLVTADAGVKVLSVIVGGDSKRGKLDAERLRRQLKQVFALFPDYAFWLTTSRRTPQDVEEMLKDFPWQYAVYYSREPLNPIADFLEQSEYVFLTSDSTSMISEAVSYGDASVEVLSSDSPGSADKGSRMISALAGLNALHLFDGTAGQANSKIDLSKALSEVTL